MSKFLNANKFFLSAGGTSSAELGTIRYLSNSIYNISTFKLANVIEICLSYCILIFLTE